MEENKTSMICSKCGVPLEPANLYLSYLKHSFHTKIMRCPKCGMPFIPEDLADGRMSEVEKTLEDK